MKAKLPNLICGALVEGPYESKEKIAALRPILGSADFLSASILELREVLGKLRTQSPQAGPR